MLKNLFGNLPDVTKNLLIINILFFIASKVYAMKTGLHLAQILGLYYFDSPFFQPYQIATHFFMHGDLWHLVFNMFGLIFLGKHLEILWGGKRFLFFYFITALGAALLHQFTLGLEIYKIAGSFSPFHNDLIKIEGDYFVNISSNIIQSDFRSFTNLNSIPTVGASGAIYGILMGIALLFPNTTVYLYFAIPVKMKWLALFAGLYALYSGYAAREGDSVAHFAHLGGMLFAFILIKIWQRNKNEFY